MWEDNIKVNLEELRFPCVNSVDQNKTRASKRSLILEVLNVFGGVGFITRELVITKFKVKELHNYSNCKHEQ